MPVDVFPDAEMLKTIREMIAEKAAKNASQFPAVHSLMAGNAQKARWWYLTSNDNAQAALDVLTEYTSAKNKVAQAYVVDPLINGKCVRERGARLGRYLCRARTRS